MSEAQYLTDNPTNTPPTSREEFDEYYERIRSKLREQIPEMIDAGRLPDFLEQRLPDFPYALGVHQRAAA